MAATRFAVDGDTFTSIDDVIREIKRQLRQRGGCPRDPLLVKRALQAIADGRFASDPTTALLVPQRPPLIHGTFAPLEEQVANVHKWNTRRRLGFLQSDLMNIPEPPVWPEHRRAAVVLVPYLDSHKGIGGIQRTFDTLWEIGSRRQKNRERCSEVRSEPEYLTLLPGITHTPGLRWEIIDLGANWDQENGIAPTDVRSPATSPHAGILAAVAHHPRWVRKMDGSTEPYVWIPGYCLAVPGHDPRVPIVDWSLDERLVLLSARWDAYRPPDGAVPAFLPAVPRESER